MPVNIEDIINQVKLIQQQTTDAKTKERLTLLLQNLRRFAQDAETDRNNLQATINQQQATIAQLQAAVATLQQQNAAQAREIEDLKKQIGGGGQQTSSATPLNLAQSFKGVIETIQTQARQTPGVATTIKGLDIEVKGLVQVGQDNTTTLALPNVGSQIDPNSLSTLRVSFGAIPVPAPEPAHVVPATAPSAAPPAPQERKAEAEKPTKAKKAAKAEKAKKGARRTKRAK